MQAMKQNETRPAIKQVSPKWSKDEVARLISFWNTGLTNKQIAEQLDRNETAVAVKASRINLPPRASVGTAKNANASVRACLRCTTPFFSSGAGNRFCDPCKDSSDWQDGSDYFSSSEEY